MKSSISKICNIIAHYTATTGPSHLESHSPQWVCVCPGNAAVCEWTSVGCTEGTLAVTGWRPTAEEDEGGEEVEVGRGGPRWGTAAGTSCGPGMAVVGTAVEERAGPGEEEEVGESDGRSKETWVERGGEEEGGDT